MKRFEYAIEQRRWSDPLEEEYLNTIGSEGWELICVTHIGERQETIQYIFKKLISVEL